MIKEDLRITKTKLAIKESFIGLLKEKQYNKISVTDIVKRANINRNTFYLHYEDKEDLVKKLLEATSLKMEVILASADFLKQTTFANITEVQIRWGLRSILKAMEQDIEFYRVVLTDSSLTGFFDKVWDTITSMISYLLAVSNPKSNLVFKYTMAGIFCLIIEWIKYKETSAAETAKILSQLSYAGLLKFKHINK